MIPQTYPLYATNPENLATVYAVIGWEGDRLPTAPVLVIVGGTADSTGARGVPIRGFTLNGGFTYWPTYEMAEQGISDQS